jgi:hypothetical protein
MNATWHDRHPMPSPASIDQRVRWHLAHAKACGYRESPRTVRAGLRRQRVPIPHPMSPAKHER